MKVFLSYAREQSAIAAEINAALSARDHDVFWDQSTLTPGLQYGQRIEQELADCNLFIALISPDAVVDQKYVVTEVGIIQRRWKNPSGRVLPVMVVPTLLNTVNAWLRAVTILYPQGNVAAEVAAATDRLLQFQGSQNAKDEQEPTFPVELLAPRIASYRELWQLTAVLPKWPRATDVTYEDLLDFSSRLRGWYFNQGGGMFLSRQAHTAYAALQDSLTAILLEHTNGSISPPHYDAVRELCSAVRTRLARDIDARK